MFANCQIGGIDLGFPDICKTPLPPFPYPNMAYGPTGIPTTFNILLSGGPWHNLMTFKPVSFGDTPGVGGGLISQTFMSRQQHLTGSFSTFIRGAPSTRVTSIGPTNLINCPSVRIMPSQIKLLLLAI